MCSIYTLFFAQRAVSSRERLGLKSLRLKMTDDDPVLWFCRLSSSLYPYLL